MGQRDPRWFGVIRALSVLSLTAAGACSSAVDSTGFEQGMLGPGSSSEASTEGLLEEMAGVESPGSDEPVASDAMITMGDAGDAPQDADVASDAGPAPDDAGPGLDDAGPGLDDAGPGLDDAGPGPDDDGSTPDANGGDEDATSTDGGASDGGPEPVCLSDEDCEAFLVQDPCRTAVCDSGVCIGEWAVDGSACDDDDPCTVNDHCELGACTASTPFDCNDGDPCTEDSCWSGIGCVQQPVVCDDGELCTVDVCDPESGCTSKVITCPPSGNPCAVNSCDDSTGSCVPVSLEDGALCDDSDACTGGEACASGDCVGESVCVCQTDDDCADASTNLCAGVSVCDLETHTCAPDASTKVVCLESNDSCTLNVCEPTTGQCSEVALEEGTVCDELGPCDAAATCEAGSCVKTPLVCDDEEICTVDSCDVTTGACAHVVEAGLDCDDGDPCTQGETCTAQGCGGGESVCECQTSDDCTQDYDVCAGVPFCNSQNICQVDPSTALVCDGATDVCKQEVCSTAAGGCVVEDAPVGLACDAGACAQDGACLQGACVAFAINCADGDACTKDSCDDALGGCLNQPLTDTPCDDGNACSGVDLCDGGVCVPGASLCECTSNAECAQGWNYCLGLPTCDPVSNTCVAEAGTASNCDGPQEPCLVSGCDPTDGSCTVTPAEAGTSCDDGELCTVADTCEAGQCVPGAVDACDDQDACTTDSCVPGQGCSYGAVVCDDQSHCTVDTCDPQLGCEYLGIVCEVPDAQCMTATCTPDDGCSEIPVVDGVGCSDGDACTYQDVCQAGQCTGKTQVCNDAIQCTIDSCDGGQCVYTPKPAGVLCDDSDACSAEDQCDATGGCVGQAKACDDGVVCTANLCVSGECVYPLLNGPSCDDEDLCTSADHCVDGSCTGEATLPASCDDDDACTMDACVAGGCTHTAVPGCGGADEDCDGVAAGGACDDGDAETTADMCLLGSCKGFVAEELSVDLLNVGFAGLNVQLNRIGYGDGAWYAIVSADGGFGGESYSASALLKLNLDGQPEIMWDTLQQEAFTDLHARVAVDEGGEVWWLNNGNWSSDSALSEAVDDSGSSDRLLTVTSIQRGEHVRVWLQGEAQNQGLYTRVCDVELDADGSIDDASCESLGWPYDYDAEPGGIAALSDCGSACLEALVVSGTNTDGEQSSFYNDAVESSTGLNDWAPGFYDPQAQKQLIRDVAGYGDNQFLIVGTHGHMRHRHPACGDGDCDPGINENGFNCPADCTTANATGAWSNELSGLVPGLSDRDLTGVWTGCDAVVVSVEHLSAGSAFELWTISQQAQATQATSWTSHVLLSNPGWNAVLSDVWGLSDGTVIAVGGGRYSNSQTLGRRAFVFVRTP